MSAIAPLCFSVPVQFEITEHPRDAVAGWIQRASLRSEDFLFPSRMHQSPHLSTRQYARTADHWVCVIGLDPIAYGTHMRRTKSILDLSNRTKNLRGCATRQCACLNNVLEQDHRCIKRKVMMGFKSFAAALLRSAASNSHTLSP
jgi:hypothetical protein